MLADARVDFIVFDVTNQETYKSYYMALLQGVAEVRAAGGRTPQVAFLTPFWTHAASSRSFMLTCTNQAIRDFVPLGCANR